MKRHIPNAVSVARMFLAVPIYLAIRDGESGRAIVILIVCLATDGVDGFLARRWNAVSTLGRMLDPLADKTVAGSVAIALHRWHGLPLWFLIAVVSRDALILIGGEWMRRRSGIVPSANMMGKITINVIVIVLLAWLLDVRSIERPGLYVGALFLAASFAVYVRVWWNVRRGKSLDRKGLPLQHSNPQK